MKKIILLTSLFILSFSQQSYSQGFFDKLFNKDNVKGVIEDIAAQHVDFNITGNWTYQGATVVLSSDNELADIGTGIATSGIDAKINSYLEKVGIKPGALNFIFKEDSTFTVAVSKRNINGKYTYNKEDQTVKLTFANIVPIKADVEVRMSEFSLLFKADGLKTFIKAIAGKVNNETISSLGAMLENYEHLKIGLKFKKAN